MSRWEKALVALALLLHGAMVVYISRTTYATVDEGGTFAAGIHNWHEGQFDVVRVSPPLVRMLAVLPVLTTSPPRLKLEREIAPWHRRNLQASRTYATQDAGNYLYRLRLARLAGALWSMLGALLLYLWGRKLYSRIGGALAMMLWIFDPTVLGHAAVMTADVPCAVTFLGATWLFWHHLRQPSWRNLVMLGIALGLAMLTKLSSLLLIPIWAVLWIAFRLRQEKQDRPRLRHSIRAAVVVALLSVTVINAGYAFRGSFRPLGDYEFVSQTLKGDDVSQVSDRPGVDQTLWSAGNRFRHSWLGALPVPFPADFVRGFDTQRRDLEGRYPSYLRGTWRDHGWWYYYAYAGAIKIPLGTLLLVLIAFGLALRTIARRESTHRNAGHRDAGHRDAGQTDAAHRDPDVWFSEFALLVPAVLVLVVVSSQVGLNHHFRYALPAFPFLFLGVGKLGTLFHAQRAKWRAGMVAFLGVASLFSVLRVYPHTLSYFNELVGPEHGDEHLLDSNIDWGQDALGLRDWVDEHPEATPLQLAYFGGSDPGPTLGLPYELPYLADPAHRYKAQQNRVRPGYIAASVNLLRGLSFPIPGGGGRWLTYLRGDLDYLLDHEPIARVGYSIRIYRLSDEDAAAINQRLGIDNDERTPTTGD